MIVKVVLLCLLWLLLLLLLFVLNIACLNIVFTVIETILNVIFSIKRQIMDRNFLVKNFEWVGNKVIREILKYTFYKEVFARTRVMVIRNIAKDKMNVLFLFGDENVEENVVKFSRFYGHVHRKNSVNFLLVEVRFGSVQFAEC